MRKVPSIYLLFFSSHPVDIVVPYKSVGNSYNSSKNGNGFKQKEGGFGLDKRNKFFIMRVVRHWHRLSREAVDAPLPGSVQGQVG